MTIPAYEILEHTADVGLKIFGKTLAELFVHGALGLVDLAGQKELAGAAGERLPLAVRASNLEDLLVNWLSEILFFMDAEGWVFREFHVSRIAEDAVEGEAIGERRDPSTRDRGIPVKAVTYHQLSVRQVEDRWEAVVYFDI